VEVTAATATEDAASSWLIAHLDECFPAECEVALSPGSMRCRGREWWTTASQPAPGPGPETRQLWRFDVRDALTMTPAVPFAVDDRPGCPREALEALEKHWRAGRISDADHERLQVLAQAEAAALERFAARVRAAPADAPRVELTDEERYAVLLLLGHVARLLGPLIDNEVARELLRSGVSAADEQARLDAARAIAELSEDLADVAETSEPPAQRRLGRPRRRT
jgi:hypothetical protein